MIPNRIVIAALDSALNRVDSKLRDCGNPHPLMAEKIGALRDELIGERAALVEARKFIAEKRKDS